MDTQSGHLTYSVWQKKRPVSFLGTQGLYAIAAWQGRNGQISEFENINTEALSCGMSLIEFPNFTVVRVGCFELKRENFKCRN